jgi:SpoVK/Ycf46/Vps4 family AAA+-type ATPase
MRKQNIQYQRPILSAELEDKLGDAVQSFEHRGKWAAWGLDKLREQGVALLLHGPPGVGKTMTAYYLAKRLHLSMCEVSIADFGSQVPGQLARNIKQIFQGEIIVAGQEKRQPAVIFLDECDAMLVSRKKLGHDMMWMLEPINMLLSQIGKYPGLVVLCTNLLPMLDEALERRLLAQVYIGRPNESTRRKIWKSKWPEKFPFQLFPSDVEKLGAYDLTGAEIENVIIIWAGRLIRQGIEDPSPQMLLEFLSNEYKNYLNRQAEGLNV